jgi:putative Ca2+/H+ antiporter (TMEM165/GDT1 family)
MSTGTCQTGRAAGKLPDDGGMWKSFAAVFITVFLAEIGDKTQLATMMFSAEGEANRWVVFAASSAALVLAAAIGVLVGAQLERFIQPRTLKLIAGLGFMAIGVWTIVSR